MRKLTRTKRKKAQIKPPIVLEPGGSSAQLIGLIKQGRRKTVRISYSKVGVRAINVVASTRTEVVSVIRLHKHQKANIQKLKSDGTNSSILVDR